MSDDESAMKAMEALNGTNLGGRNLTVNEARPKADRIVRRFGLLRIETEFPAVSRVTAG